MVVGRSGVLERTISGHEPAGEGGLACAIDFYFDFASPYGYLASLEIDALAARHGRTVAWRPILLGAVFKVTGALPLTETPLKGAYLRRDVPRLARLRKVPLTFPDTMPMSALAASRAVYSLMIADDDPARGKALAAAVFHAHWGEGRDMGSADAVASLAEPLGLDRAALAAACTDPAAKTRLRTETDQAIDRGVFGSPFFFVDDEPFWGVDRLDQVDAWSAGGW